jgi:sensor c-di-GMP phosphodiesterase-like protein
MNWLSRAFTRRNIVAIAAGVLLAGAPFVAFDLWLGNVIDRQAQEEVATSAKRAIALAEARVTHVVRALDALAQQGTSACRNGDLEAMRHAVFKTTPIKEIDILGPGGQTLCDHLGLPVGARSVLSSDRLAGSDGYFLDVVRLDGGRRMVRLRRKAAAGGNALAALVPTSLFLPQVSTRGAPFHAYASIATRAGTTIGKVGRVPKTGIAGMFSATAASSKFGFKAEVVAPRGPIPADKADMRWFALIASAGVIVLVGIVVWLIGRRAPGNPVDEIERALAAGEFVPYYQPVVDIRSGQLRGAEVLVRWKKADGTLVLPGAFIPLAESSGLIREMTRDLMRRVCVEAGEVLGRRPAMKISFNFAGKLFSDESIVKDVRKIFSSSPIKLSQVVLEVTERDPIENFTEARQVIAALQGLGVRIAIDDVGTGHSGLSYMLKLGVDMIKIDKMFVDAIGTDRNSTTIVETLIDLAHNMRMDVVAEGVENFEQVTHLRELGVRSAQGYVFAPPLPGSAFLQLVAAIDPVPAALEPAAKGAAGAVKAA